MFTKPILISAILLAPNIAFSDLSEQAQVTVGERLSQCLERRIPLIDRIGNNSIRSYTKYDKHYISLNNNSIYVDYDIKENDLTVMFINNNHVEKITSAEIAKQTLQDIKQTLVEPTIKLCKKTFGIAGDVKFSMLYVDPPVESRIVKEVIRMDASGRFLLP
ncbi:MAG: hypothetical protein QM504_02940 [Pseudomonadota bacterium]